MREGGLAVEKQARGQVISKLIVATGHPREREVEIKLAHAK